MNKCLVFVLLPIFLLKSQEWLTNSEYINNLNTITTAVPFLTIAPDSRSGAMGDLGVATSPDVYSLHWNSAKLAFLPQGGSFAISYTPWLSNLVPDISLSHITGYYKLNKISTVAGSLRYFSLGNIQFTDGDGWNIGEYDPNEYVFDLGYSMKLSDHFSAGLVMKYIYSNLTGGLPVEGLDTQAGQSFAVDLGTYYESKKFKLTEYESQWAVGLNISNIGGKISYTESGDEDFLPMNLRIGGRLSTEIDDYNRLMVAFDINKLLVPSPPIYDSSGDTDPENIIAGRNPNVGVVQGIFQSFSDAPGGIEEEFNELMYSVGGEYWYDNQFAFRFGYFHEHETKGNRKYFTLGASLKLNVFGIDFAYLIPANSSVRSPLENTIRFSLVFDLENFNSESLFKSNRRAPVIKQKNQSK
tara:strand:+ start:994 stop:2232 length:1239 start_codon:yes stop_codon:yes gene_type:complete